MSGIDASSADRGREIGLGYERGPREPVRGGPKSSISAADAGTEASVTTRRITPIEPHPGYGEVGWKRRGVDDITL